MTLFDNMNQIGTWKMTNGPEETEFAQNIIEVDAGSLKFTYAAIPQQYPYNFGGHFYTRPPYGKWWDFSQEPKVIIRIKADNPVALSGLILAVVIDADWHASHYDLSSLISTGYQDIEVDLRYPTGGVLFPDLSAIRQFAFYLSKRIENQPFNVENIQHIAGPTIPLEATISPTEAQIFIGDTTSFTVTTRGGEQPITFTWYVDDQQMLETSSILTLIGSAAATRKIDCTVEDAIYSIMLSATLTIVEPPPPPPPPPEGPDYLKSELRGVLIHTPWFRNPNWPLIAKTCLTYGINSVYIETYPSHFSSGRFTPLDTALAAFHAAGLKAHILNTIGLVPINDDMRVRDAAGNIINWTCFVRQASLTYFSSMAASLAGTYAIDGFQFDYIRWNGTKTCFCDQCNAKFLTDTGLTDTRWPQDVVVGGRYHWNWIDWRKDQITAFIRMMRDIMLALKPTLEISAAAFTAFSDTNSWQTMAVGQDAGQWVSEGLLDHVNPMVYTDNVSGGNESFQDYIRSSLKFWTGGDVGPGVIPLVAYLQPVERTPYDLKIRVDILRSMGAKGWILWRYGGPGLEALVDIRPYLQILTLPQAINITNIMIFVNPEETEATITWKTSSPASSEVEYSNTHLFNYTLITGEYGRQHHYYDVNYVGGQYAQDAILKTHHQMMLPMSPNGLFFRIKSVAENGETVVTTVHHTDESSGLPPPRIESLIPTVASVIAGTLAVIWGISPG